MRTFSSVKVVDDGLRESHRLAGTRRRIRNAPNFGQIQWEITCE
jgi:hypothetical protein